MNCGRVLIRACARGGPLKRVNVKNNFFAPSRLLPSASLTRDHGNCRHFSLSGSRLMGSGSVGDGGASTLTPELKERIDKMVKETDVVVFMKVYSYVLITY